MGDDRLESLRSLPFPEQRALIEASVASGQHGAALLRVTASLPDHEPLALAATLMAEAGQVDAPEVHAALDDIFPKLSDTAIQRVLRRLIATHLPKNQLDIFVSCVSRTVSSLDADRIAALCLMDRWLKNAAPEAHRRLEEESLAAVEAATVAEETDNVSDALLIRLPGPKLTARSQSAIWRRRLKQLADDVIGVLEEAPKSLSQANAEEILATQVYTDPGHFLIELLQNAEDAGASRWIVEIADQHLSVWHDGADFDARDVVGLLSIGQSTKSRGQIGFFGVGFKSVYEICERPQVYSGLFNFEIADVSLPRQLGRRPSGHPEGGTLLVLPHRSVDDPLRRPEALYRYACQVPAETLLTLDNLRHLEARFGASSRTVIRRPASTPSRVELVHDESSEVRTFLVAEDRFEYEGSRDTHRAATSPVLVAIELDEGGRSRPLPEQSATVFSYLPTGETSGLRFMVHAHFDLPVDRERLDLDATWNVWALSNAGELLARCAEVLVGEHLSEKTTESAERLRALLQVIPRPGELGRRGYEVIIERLQQRASSIPMLLGRAGELLEPTRGCVITDDALADVLAGVELTVDGRYALATLAPREADVALNLGAASFAAPELVDLLERVVETCRTDGPPGWLVEALPTIFTFLGSGDIDVERLHRLALIPDHLGSLRRPDEVVRAAPSLRSFYGALRPFVVEALDLGATPEQQNLLDELGVRRLVGADLINDLREMPAIIGEVMHHGLTLTLLELLEDLPTKLTADLGHLPLFPDEEGKPGALRPLEQSYRFLWISPQGDLGELLRGVTDRSLTFISMEVQRRFSAFLERLGGERLTLEALLGAIERREIDLSDPELNRLHTIIESYRHSLTPTLCRRLSGTPLFTDNAGNRRPLRGSRRALIPMDEDLPALIPGAPWLSTEMTSLTYISRGLGVSALGPADVVRALLLEDEGGDVGHLIDPFDDGQLRDGYAYLIAHAEGIPRPLIERLAEAPLWLDTSGERHVLSELRLPPASPSLASFYQDWGVLKEIGSGADSTAALAATLGLAERVRPTNHSTFVADLLGCTDTRALGKNRDRLTAALAEARTELSLREFRTLRDAAIFRDTLGELRPLGSWTEAGNHERCARALSPFREALSFGSTPLLSLDDEDDFAEVLDVLDAAPAQAEDLIDALEKDPMLARSEAIDAAREVLATIARDLALDFTPRSDGTGHPRLQGLRIWPTSERTYRRAPDVVRPDALRAMLPEGDELSSLGDAQLSILSSSALGQADALRGLFVFRNPAVLIIARVREEAAIGASLSEQSPLLRHVGRIVKLLRICYEHLDSIDATLGLPLVVDGAGKLASGRHFLATAEELKLMEGIDDAPTLADTTWSQGAIAIEPGLAPRAAARRLLSALASSCRDELPVTEHPLLGSADARQRLYWWLLGRRDEIENDTEALGILGRAHLIPTAGGVFGTPRTLLLDPTLPDLGLGWGAADELPEELVEWLRETFRLDEGRTKQLVEHVVSGHREAVASGDVERSGELLQFLGRALALQAEGGRSGRAGLEVLARRYKLHRRLKVADDRGGFERPGRLLFTDRHRWDLIKAFHGNPPAHVSSHYGAQEQRELLFAAGTKEDLEIETLENLLTRGDWLRPGALARIALARYLVIRALEEPSIKSTLSLNQRPWIPSGVGELKRPKDLYWPDDRVRAILGDRTAEFPDPEVIHTSPAELGEAFDFKRSDDIALEHVVTRLTARNAPAPEALLDWLEETIAEKRTTSQELRDALKHIPFLVDDQGRLRAPVDIVPDTARDLFAGHRGSWDGAKRWQRLASVLRITRSRHIDREVRRFLEEIGRRVTDEGGEALLAAEPELATALPRCLDRLAREISLTLSGALPSPLPLICVDAHNVVTLVLSDDESVVLPEPEPLAELAETLALPLLYPIVPADAVDDFARFLRNAGLSDLLPRWRPRTIVHEDTESAAHRSEAKRLETSLEALWPLLPRVAMLGGQLGRSPSVRAAASITIKGALDGVDGEASFVCAWDRLSNTLLVTTTAFWELDEVASLLWRELSVPSTNDDGALLDLLTQLLSLDHRSHMEALLDQHGHTQAPQRGPYRQQHSRDQRDQERLHPRKKRTSGQDEDKVDRETHISKAREQDEDPEPSTGGSDREETGDEERSDTPDVDESRGLLSRLKRWLRSEPDEDLKDQPAETKRPQPSKKERKEGRKKGRKESAPPPPQPPRAKRLDGRRGGGSRQHAQWFKPENAQESQLRSAPAWLADRQRPPEFGFAFAPSHLPIPWTYAVKLLSSRFDRHSQSWSHEVTDPSWCEASGVQLSEVRLKGQVPKGHVVLPVPLYGRITDLVSSPSARHVQTRDGLTMLLAEEHTDLTYTVALDRPPTFEVDGAALPDRLASPLRALTVPDGELPEEVHLFLDALYDSGSPASLESALEIREFIKTRYRYDPSYLEDEGVARWLRNVSFARPNVHIAALHAGRDGRHLGRGVCYDLNVLACELLRRVGIPAAIASGWTFSGGSVAEPDHLWAMALLQTGAGWRWFPIDAATTSEGRPLQLPRRPAGPWRVKAPPKSSRQPETTLKTRKRRSKGSKRRAPQAAVPKSEAIVAVRRAIKVKAPPRLPVTELVRLARQLETLTGERFGSAAKLRKRFELLLRDPERLSRLLRLLGGKD